MAQVTAEQLLEKVKAQGGRIAELEVINAALTHENAMLVVRVGQLEGQLADTEAKDVAGAITEASNARVPRAKGSKE